MWELGQPSLLEFDEKPKIILPINFYEETLTGLFVSQNEELSYFFKNQENRYPPKLRNVL